MSQGREATIVVAADWAPIRSFEPLVRKTPEAAYGDMLPVLRQADLRIVNCECALTASRNPVWKSGSVFKGRPIHVRGLTAVPFEVACLANNHVFDYGLNGFHETLDVLHRNGIRTVGAGLDEPGAWRPLSFTLKTNKISIINFSEGEDTTAAKGGPGVCGWDIDRVTSLVRQRKKRGDCVIAVAHAGLEYIPYPPPYIVKAFRAVAEAGADCVIGHHPHVPQGMEIHKSRPIFYSLGNFLFDQSTNLHYRKIGSCVSLRLTENSLSGFDLHPYKITKEGLIMLKGPEERAFRHKLRQISKPLSSSASIQKAWQAYLAFYGLKGFAAEARAILAKMTSEPQKGAAMFKNRITTPQHAELWRDTMSYIISGKIPPPSHEMTRTIEEWFSKTIHSSA